MKAAYRLALALGLATTLFATSGLAKPKSTPAPVFFPPPPDEPRIQFLASFATEEQFAELGGNRAFFRFIVGKEKVFRPIVKPYGITTTPGKIYICDTAPATIEILDLEKQKLRYFKPGGNGTLGTPINIAVDGDGTRYITDTKRGQLLIFKEDNYVDAIGKRDELKPAGVALTKNRIYLTDLKNHCVRVYDKGSRKELFTFPKEGADEKSGKLFSPTNVAITNDGNVWVTDTGGFLVNEYELEGKYIRTVGQMGLSPGTFSLPKGIATDRDNRLYVVDANTQVVQLFDKEGRILMYFGDPSSAAGGATSLPAGITVDYDNVSRFQKFAAPNFSVEYLIYVTNQTGGHKVSVFGFGHKK